MALAVFLDLVHLLNGATNRKSMPTLLALKGLLSIILGESRKAYPESRKILRPRIPNI